MRQIIKKYRTFRLRIAILALAVGIGLVAVIEGTGQIVAGEMEVSPPYVSEERKKIFQNRFLKAPFNRAFAISKDGAFGGQWGKDLTLDDVRRAALESCRKKPQYRPDNPCQIYMENDTVVWTDLETAAIPEQQESDTALSGEWRGYFISSNGNWYPVSFNLKAHAGRVEGEANIPSSSYDRNPTLLGVYRGNSVHWKTSSPFSYDLTMSKDKSGRYQLKGRVTGSNTGRIELTKE